MCSIIDILEVRIEQLEDPDIYIDAVLERVKKE